MSLAGDCYLTTIHKQILTLRSQYYQEAKGRYFLYPTQAAQLHLCLSALASMEEENDPLCLARANMFMGSAYGYAHALQIAKKYFKRSVDIIKKYEIRFVPIPTGGTAQQRSNILASREALEEVRERAAFLAQTLHTKTWAYLVGHSPFNMGFEFFGGSKSEVPVSF